MRAIIERSDLNVGDRVECTEMGRVMWSGTITSETATQWRVSIWPGDRRTSSFSKKTLALIPQYCSPRYLRKATP